MKAFFFILFFIVVAFIVAHLEGEFLVKLDKKYQEQIKNKNELIQKNLELETLVFTLEKELEELKNPNSEESQIFARTLLGWIKDSEQLYHLDKSLLDTKTEHANTP